MDYISTWGYCYCYFKWEDFIYEENKNIFDASDCFIYECVAVENDMLVIQYGEEKAQIPYSSYETVDTPRYKLGEEVYISRKKRNGKIYSIAWNIKEQAHIYLLEIDGKKDFQKYSSYALESEPKYQIGEEVYIPRRKKNGKIIDRDWHYKNQAHMYFVEINGKKYSRRYYENELRKLYLKSDERNCSYDELKEDVWDKFNYWYYKMGVSSDRVVDVIMDDYASTAEISMADKLCILTFLFLSYMKKDLYSARILILMNDLLINNKEEIQRDLGEDYDRLSKEIDLIMDKYWKRVETLALHELEIIYRRKVTAEAKNIIDKVVQEENIFVEDIFYGATRRIEYALLYNDTIISVSLVDDLSYDFTVFTVCDEDLDDVLGDVIYNNTQILLSIDDLYDILRNDLKRQTDRMSRRRKVSYISTWGVYPRAVETANWVHEEDIEEFYAVTAHGPRVFECIAEKDNMLVLQYGDKTFRVNPRYYGIVAEPLFKLGEEVYIPRKEKNGIILNIDWHSKKQAHMYYLRIEGKKYSRRYYEDELRKLHS